MPKDIQRALLLNLYELCNKLFRLTDIYQATRRHIPQHNTSEM